MFDCLCIALVGAVVAVGSLNIIFTKVGVSSPRPFRAYAHACQRMVDTTGSVEAVGHRQLCTDLYDGLDGKVAVVDKDLVELPAEGPVQDLSRKVRLRDHVLYASAIDGAAATLRCTALADAIVDLKVKVVKGHGFLVAVSKAVAFEIACDISKLIVANDNGIVRRCRNKPARVCKVVLAGVVLHVNFFLAAYDDGPFPVAVVAKGNMRPLGRRRAERRSVRVGAAPVVAQLTTRINREGTHSSAKVSYPRGYLHDLSEALHPCSHGKGWLL